MILQTVRKNNCTCIANIPGWLQIQHAFYVLHAMRYWGDTFLHAYK